MSDREGPSRADDAGDGWGLNAASIRLYSEEGLALQFAEAHAGDLRFVDVWKAWLRWDGQCWREDDTLAAFDLVRKLCRARCEEPLSVKDQHRLASARTVAAVLTLARADERLAASAEKWDADPDLLNVPEAEHADPA